MAENLLSDARVRTATAEVDGPYLPDGGGLRIRLLPVSRTYPRGARLAEYHFKLKDGAGQFKHGSIHLGTIGDAFTDDQGRTRAFGLKDARAARDAARDLVGRGIDPREARKLSEREAREAQRKRLAYLEGRRTLGQAFAEWHARYLSDKRADGGAFVEALFRRHVLPALGDKPLDDLQTRDIADCLDRIIASGARRTANMALSLIRQLMRWCAARDWVQRDPTMKLSKAAVGGTEKPRDRVLTFLEIVALRDLLPMSGLPARMQAAVWVLLATGARVGELSAARKADFDLAGRVWVIPETKNGSEHLVHLSAFAVRHLNELFEASGKSAFLLPGRPPAHADDDTPERPISEKAITKLLVDRQRDKPLKGRAKASSALVLPRGKWTAHDLRRTMATRMRELGVGSDVVERCLNHKPQGILAVYQTGELLPQRKAAFELWGDELQRLQGADTTNVVALHRATGEAAA